MIIEELNKRHSLSIEAAKKRQKFDHIELLNADLKKGKLLVLENEATRALVDEIELLEWDHVERSKGKWVEAAACENHACDALLYIWRESLGFLHTPGEVVHQVGSDGWFQAEERRMEEAALAQIEDQASEWWEFEPEHIN